MTSNAFGEGRARKQFHRQERLLVLATDVVDGHHMRVIESGLCDRFAQHGIDLLGTALAFSPHDLDGHVPLQRGVQGAIDSPHATLTKLFLEFEVTEDMIGHRVDGV